MHVRRFDHDLFLVQGLARWTFRYSQSTRFHGGFDATELLIVKRSPNTTAPKRGATVSRCSRDRAFVSNVVQRIEMLDKSLRERPYTIC